MRIADKMGYNQVTGNLQKNRSDMADLQNQAATQKRITKPSDDPSAAARVLNARTDERGSKQFVKNINVARSFLEFTDQSLAEMTEALTRAKELAIAQSNDAAASPDSRRAVAAEVEQLYNQAVQIGNRKLGERYIFGGYRTTTQPFDISGEYHGDDGNMKVQINKDAFVGMNISGDKVFLGKGLGSDGLVRSSGEVPRDAHELMQYEQKDMQRRQQMQQMENQPVELRAPASVEGRDGAAVHSVEDPEQKGVDILKSLKDFQIALTTNDKEEIQNAIDTMDQAITQVVNIRAQVGSRVSSLNAATDSLQKAIVDSKTHASQLEDADLFEVVSDINKTDSTLKATLETSSKVTNLSLLDFLK
jgi:flagellar hook-associated protein 3 FlgL